MFTMSFLEMNEFQWIYRRTLQIFVKRCTTAHAEPRLDTIRPPVQLLIASVAKKGAR